MLHLLPPRILRSITINGSDLLDSDSVVNVLGKLWVQDYFGLRLCINQAIMSPVEIAPTVYELPNGAYL